VTEITISKPTRTEIVSILRERDGDVCQYPGHAHPLDFEVNDESPAQVTIDHHIPQHFGKANGWTYEEIWDLSNLKLMCKKHNAQKGDRVPNPDGTLPERTVRKFRYRRDKRAGRPELCMECDNGHDLFSGEICRSCGCDAQRFPRNAKVRFDDCDHDIMWCWVCSITPDMRTPAMVDVLSDEEDED
jgi:hypothetical protein